MTKGKKQSISYKLLIYAIILCFAGGVGWYLKGKTIIQARPTHSVADPYVITGNPVIKDIAPKRKFIATVESINSVDIKPQVSGYIDQVLFKNGSFVNENDTLFILEQNKYAANVDIKKAALEKAKANYNQLKSDYERQKKLLKEKILPAAEFEVVESTLAQAEAGIKEAEADLKLAEINLDYTTITSPISGYIGKALMTKGNYVDTNTTSLARIVQTDPIRISFSVTDKDRLTGLSRIKPHNMTLQIVLSDGEIMTVENPTIFTDNEANNETATMAVYAEFENKNQKLIPGNYIDILIGNKEEQKSLTVPQTAIVQDMNGHYVLTVDSENTVSQKYVKLGEMSGKDYVILEGLSPDDKIIIQGTQKVQNGQKVKTTEVIE